MKPWNGTFTCNLFWKGDQLNQIGQSEFFQNLTRTLVFSIWVRLVKRRWGLVQKWQVSPWVSAILGLKSIKWHQGEAEAVLAPIPAEEGDLSVEPSRAGTRTVAVWQKVDRSSQRWFLCWHDFLKLVVNLNTLRELGTGVNMSQFFSYDPAWSSYDLEYNHIMGYWYT